MPSNADLYPCPFIFGPKITDMRLFVGRKQELRAIADRINGVQPVSVNLIGERRIGKSSLLYALTVLWDQYLPSETRRRDPALVYLDLQEISPSNERKYYQEVLDALREQSIWKRFPDLQRAIRECAPDRDAFRTFLQKCQDRNVLPVICLDEFEVLLGYPQAFDDSFFDVQRGYMNSNALMYVIASLHPLDTYRRSHRLTSSFFNLGHSLKLGEFSEEEASDLARLPASTVPGAPAALSLEEQRLARAWGQRHPCLLQMAGYFLCQARQQGKDSSWAYQQFQLERSRVPASRSPRAAVVGAARAIWNAPLWLGRLAQWLGQRTDDVTNLVAGITIIVIIVLVLLGYQNPDALRVLLEKLLGSTP
ncbi:hypothetical protein [uncultured Chloroflexus sp.]|uniref:hypothetical protein n=1 Tax=uncultured Chloroflexus sp. TaxID=214040 RepID=UPI00260408BC|nr:hypothetical protein [uncultured Chloroflexus sp.]